MKSDSGTPLAIPKFVLETLHRYFVDNLRGVGHGPVTALWDPELDDEASDCCKLQVSGFLSLFASLENEANLVDRAREIARGVYQSSESGSWFTIPFNVQEGSTPISDIAEYGAAIDSLFWATQHDDDAFRIDFFGKIAERILQASATERDGAFYKNANATQLNVLNGDVYGALALTRAFEVTGNARYLEAVCRTVEHLIERFGVHHQNGWSYSETWDGEEHTGFSLAYQATMIGWGSELLPILPLSLRNEWELTLNAAQKKLTSAFKQGVCDATEAPSWSRNWDEVWELQLANGRWSSKAEHEELTRAVSKASIGVLEHGIGFFSDSRPRLPLRSPIGTTMRKAANFCAVMMSLHFGSSIAPCQTTGLLGAGEEAVSAK